MELTALAWPYEEEIPYSTCPVVCVSVVHATVAAEVVIEDDCTDKMFAGVLVKTACESVLNSWFVETVATVAPSGFDLMR